MQCSYVDQLTVKLQIVKFEKMYLRDQRKFMEMTPSRLFGRFGEVIRKRPRTVVYQADARNLVKKVVWTKVVRIN